MCLLILLALIAIILTVIVVAVVSVGGATFIIVFADVIVCVLVIAWIIKRFINR